VDPTDDDPSPGEPGGTPPDFGDDDGGDSDSGPSQQEQRQNQIDNAVQDVIANSPFASVADDVATEFQGGSVETELTGAAQDLRQEAQSLIDTNPAADVVEDLSIGDDVSVRDQVQRSFDRSQAVQETITESRFADEADDVVASFQGGDVVTELTGDAAQARSEAQELIESNPAADALADVVIDEGDASSA
jgi:hypothetical protein